MKRLEDIMLSIRNLLMLQYPFTHDKDTTYTNRITCNASSMVTDEFDAPAGWWVIVKRIHVDEASDCSYKWFYHGITQVGNEINFAKPMILRPGEKIRLEMTNAGSEPQTVDVIIECFGRMVERDALV